MTERLRTEVAVVGAGPAGIAATVHAAEAGRRVLLLDPAPRPGGQIWRHWDQPPRAGRRWLERLRSSGADLLPEAAVVDAPAAGTLLVERREEPLHVGYDALVVATGARELLLPFPGWTTPGVIGAGAAQALRESSCRFDGQRVVVAGSGPLLLAAASALRRAGAQVVGLVEQAPRARLAAFAAGLVRSPHRLVQAAGHMANLAGVPCRTGAWVAEAVGHERLERVVVSDGRREWDWDCDLLACGFGLVPNLELPRLLGCKTTGDGVVLDASQRTSVPSVFAAGELGGIAGVDQALASGAIAGLAAAGRPAPPALLRRREREQRFAARLSRSFALRGELRALARPDTFVCRCEDVPLARIREAASIAPTLRGIKLHTRAGMGPCQGRVCGAALSFLFGSSADTIRPPLLPTPLGVLAEADAEGVSPEAGPREEDR